MDNRSPGIDEIRALQTTLGRWLLRTPVVRCAALEDASGARVFAKLEFLQRTATFKPRGALAVMLNLTDEQRAAGVTAVSAGNHAIAVAYAARELGVNAKVVMLKSASRMRMARCREYGAQLELADDVHQAFDRVADIQQREGRYLVHPFEGPLTSLGTATLGLEIAEQVPDLDAVLVPIGGGGLCSGVAAAVKQLKPQARIYGIEPDGADSMHRSFASGKPERLERVATIADSLGAPFALPYSYALCRRHVDELVRLQDQDIAAAMRLLFSEMHLAVEPACASSTAALLGPLKSTLAGKTVVLVMCGSNTDWQTWQEQAWNEAPDAA